MKKIIFICISIVLLFSACISFGPQRPGGAAESLADNLETAHSRIGLRVSGRKYYIAPFEVGKIIGSDKNLSEDVILSFQRSLYDSYRDSLPRNEFLSPEEIRAETKKLAAKISNKAYKQKHMAIARALGADILIIGRFRYMGLLGGWLAEAELLKLPLGNVLVKAESSFVP